MARMPKAPTPASAAAAQMPRRSARVEMASPPALVDADAALPLPTGAVVAGHRIDSVLAAGCTGYVYRATELLLQRPVALKEYFVAGCSRRGDDGVQVVPATPEMVTRPPAAWLRAHDAFVGEARRLAAVRHAGVVPVWRLVESHGTVLRAMPLLAAAALADAPPCDGSAADAQRWCERVRALREALYALHERGAVHGHLHPRQVVLDGQSQPVLLGFGAAARALSARVDAGHEAFVAPEAFELAGRGPCTPAGDVYALGALAWFMATGRAPMAAAERALGARFDVFEPLAAALGSAAADDPQVHALALTVARSLSLDASARPLAMSAWRAPQVVARPPVAVATPRHDAAPAAGVVAAARAAPSPAPDPVVAGARADAAGDDAVRQAIAAALGSIAADAASPRSVPGRNGVVPALAGAGPSLPEAPPARDDAPLRNAAAVSLGWRVAAGAFVAVVLASGLLALWWAIEPGDDVAAGVSAAAAVRALPAADPLSRLEPPAAGLSAAPPPAADAAAAPGPTEPVAARGSAAAPTARASTAAPVRVAATPAAPRAACGNRSNFSLLRCMQAQCRKPQYVDHAQCQRLRATGDVD